MINLKTAHEIDLMARAGSLLASVLPPLKEACEPGVKTIELDRIADRLIREGGATPGFLGYNGFPRSICVSINDEAVHGLSLIHISEPTRLGMISYAVFCLK